MKTLYLDCGMGAAGDMLSAALIELFDDPQSMVDKLNGIGIPDVRFSLEKAVKCGITGAHMHVHVHGTEEHAEHHDHDHDHSHTHEHHHDHHHSSVAEITHIIADHLSLPEEVKQNALRVFTMIAEAESHVHGVPVTDIHFHEVGTMDAVADVVCVSYLLHELQVGQVIASPVQTGTGQVHCAHGVLPVPAPATAYLLRGIPIYSGEIRGELCTPTGAALLKAFVTRFGDMPVMRTHAIGYGMGTKDFPAANCIRAMLGETEDRTGFVTLLACNVDDMTGEEIGYAVGKLFEAGALDVYTTPIYMKKNRPGFLLRVMCVPADKDKLVREIFRYTTTIGVRESEMKRYTLDRRTETAETANGTVRYKISEGFGVQRVKPEADDLSRIADETGCSFREAARLAEEQRN